MAEDKTVIIVKAAQDYFREQILEAFKKLNAPTLPDIQAYLVYLLNDFISSDRLFATGPNNKKELEPLAMQYLEALSEKEKQNQRQLLRHLGDQSLYTAGFFQDSIDNKVVDLDYYIDMGQTAYRHVASLYQETHLQELYNSLSKQFPFCVDVLAQVNNQTSPQKEENLLRIYEKWILTGSARLEKTLKQAGITPVHLWPKGKTWKKKPH